VLPSSAERALQVFLVKKTNLLHTAIGGKPQAKNVPGEPSR
jgi:hypothetical protein